MSKTTTHEVTLANTNSGAVHGHKAGCADLARGKAYKNHRAEQFTVEVATKRDAWLEYNSDFIAEGGEENAYSVEWLPCADHVPAGDTEPVEAAPAPAPKKATKADVIAQIKAGSDYTHSALQKMTLAALEALLAEQQVAAASEPAKKAPAAPAKEKRAKNTVVEVDGCTVQVAAWVVIHRDGKRIALIRRTAVPVLTSAEAAKVLRVQTEYAVDKKSIGWVRNGESLASVARIAAKALKAAK